MKRKLLIVIDPQNDFTHPAGAYAQRHPVSEIVGVKKRIAGLLSGWNKRNIVVVYSNYQPGQFEEGLEIAIPGSVGHQLDADLAFDKVLRFFEKTTHSAFSSNEFAGFLKKESIEELYLCGFLAEYCVRQTALDALENKFRVCLVEDCIGTGDDVLERKEKMMVELKEKGAFAVESKYMHQQFS